MLFPSAVRGSLLCRRCEQASERLEVGDLAGLFPPESPAPLQWRAERTVSTPYARKDSTEPNRKWELLGTRGVDPGLVPIASLLSGTGGQGQRRAKAVG